MHQSYDIKQSIENILVIPATCIIFIRSRSTFKRESQTCGMSNLSKNLLASKHKRDTIQLDLDNRGNDNDSGPAYFTFDRNRRVTNQGLVVEVILQKIVNQVEIILVMTKLCQLIFVICTKFTNEILSEKVRQQQCFECLIEKRWYEMLMFFCCWPLSVS